jgi:GTPase SAR1 family protein
MERRYLVANKIDLIEDRQVSEELGQRVRNLELLFL